jgi:hypothetical protein
MTPASQPIHTRPLPSGNWKLRTACSNFLPDFPIAGRREVYFEMGRRPAHGKTFQFFARKHHASHMRREPLHAGDFGEARPRPHAAGFLRLR